MSAHSSRPNQSRSRNQHNSNTYRNANKTSNGNRRYKKIGQMTKEQKERVWTILASYSLRLIEMAAEAKSRGQPEKFKHSPDVIVLFEKCGLRPPRNGKEAEKLYEEFMNKIKSLHAPLLKKQESTFNMNDNVESIYCRDISSSTTLDVNMDESSTKMTALNCITSNMEVNGRNRERVSGKKRKRE